MLLLRKYQSADCKQIVELFYNTVHSVNKKDYNEAQLEAWAPNEINSSTWDKSLLEHYSVVVEKNSLIIGFGDLDKTGYLDRLYVHKDYQGLGVATIIVNQLEKYAQAKGVKIITTAVSITAKSFFEKCGYRTIKEQTVERKGQYLTNFIMQKNIAI